MKYLGASQSCAVGNVTLFAKDDGSRRQRWVLREVKGSTPKPSPPIKPNKLPAPLILIAYPTGSTTGTVTISPSAGATDCVLSYGGGDIPFVPQFPTTTIDISALEPGVVDLVSCVCNDASGIDSAVSNEMPISVPTEVIDTPAIEVVVPDSSDSSNAVNITYSPPTGGSCTAPNAYKVTYTTNGQTKSVTVSAAQPYGTALTNVNLSNLNYGSSYNIACVGVCEAIPGNTSRPIEISVTTPAASPPPPVLPPPLAVKPPAPLSPKPLVSPPVAAGKTPPPAAAGKTPPPVAAGKTPPAAKPASIPPPAAKPASIPPPAAKPPTPPPPKPVAVASPPPKPFVVASPPPKPFVVASPRQVFY